MTEPIPHIYPPVQLGFNAGYEVSVGNAFKALPAFFFLVRKTELSLILVPDINSIKVNNISSIVENYFAYIFAK